MAKATEWPKLTQKTDDIDSRQWSVPTDPVPPPYGNWKLISVVDNGTKVIGYWEKIPIK